MVRISAFEISEYAVLDYHYAYTWKSWSIWGQRNAINAMNESNEMNELNESNESNEMNEMNESIEPNESIDSHQLNESNESKELNKSNELNELNEPIEPTESNDSHQLNESNESIELNDSHHSTDSIHSPSARTSSPLWVQLDHRSSPTLSQQLSLFSFSLQGPRYPYRRYRVAILGTRVPPFRSFEENFGWHTTWFPEFFPFLTLSRFPHAVFFSDNIALYYNVEFSMRSLFSKEELKAEKVSFRIEPDLPKGVALNSFTGELSGVFVCLQGVE